jgi:hypothetical protein
MMRHADGVLNAEGKKRVGRGGREAGIVGGAMRLKDIRGGHLLEGK